MRAKLLGLLLGVLAAGLVLAGCGRKATGITSADAKAFANAPADIKAVWEQAIAADKSSDYVAAQAAFRQLREQHLTPEQQTAVQNAARANGENLLNAFNKGDPAAQKAMEALRQQDNRRGPPSTGTQ
ncbi:MAG: hypothetical protein NT154_11240 [Verrucomicrobia bacterium]|nr:hypothetical protein [Verrucomicrobiota bacterium]